LCHGIANTVKTTWVNRDRKRSDEIETKPKNRNCCMKIRPDSEPSEESTQKGRKNFSSMDARGGGLQSIIFKMFAFSYLHLGGEGLAAGGKRAPAGVTYGFKKVVQEKGTKWLRGRKKAGVGEGER